MPTCRTSLSSAWPRRSALILHLAPRLAPTLVRTRGAYACMLGRTQHATQAQAALLRTPAGRRPPHSKTYKIAPARPPGCLPSCCNNCHPMHPCPTAAQPQAGSEAAKPRTSSLARPRPVASCMGMACLNCRPARRQMERWPSNSSPLQPAGGREGQAGRAATLP